MNPVVLTMPARKIEILRYYATFYGLRTMIETGLWQGRGSGMQLLDLCPVYYALDIQPENCAQAKRECPEALVVCGDSRWTLPTVLARVAGPALVWLDAHYLSAGEGFGGCPLLYELVAVAGSHGGRQHVVLIDDVRLMGEEGYPALETVREFAQSWDREEAEDIMRLTPR